LTIPGSPHESRLAGCVALPAARPAATAAWLGLICGSFRLGRSGLARLGQRFYTECTPGYYNNEGRPNPKAIQNGFYGGGPIRFVEVLEAWRAAGDFAGLAREQRLLSIPAADNVLRLLPPLTVSDAELDEALATHAPAPTGATREPR